MILGQFPNVFEGTSYYRGDARGFSEIFHKGFTAYGTNTDLLLHLGGIEGSSAYISMSVYKNIAARFPYFAPYGKNRTYLYEVHTPRPMINVVDDLANLGLFDKKSLSYRSFDEMGERLISKIKPGEIKGCWAIDVTREMIVNPEPYELKGYPKEWIEKNCYRAIRTPQEQFIPNPNYSPSGLSTWKVARTLGHTLTGIGVVLDANQLYYEYTLSKEAGNYTNTYREASRIAGGWTGAFKAGTFCAEQALIYSAPLTPLGQTACVIVSGLVGSGLGYYFGGEITKMLYDFNRNEPRMDVKFEKTIQTNKLICNVSTYQDGTRIGKCVINTSYNQENKDVTKPSEVVAEITHNPSSELMEKSVYGTVVVHPAEHLKSTSQSNQLPLQAVNDGTELEFRAYSVLPQFSFFKGQTKITETTSKQSSQGNVYEADEDFSVRSSKGNG